MQIHVDSNLSFGLGITVAVVGLFDDQRYNSSHLRGDSYHSGGDSSHLPGDSGHLPGNSSHLPRQWEELKAIAAPVAGTGNAAPELVQQVILKLCAGRYLTLEQLGDLLDRNPAGLRNRFLTPMVTAGLLRLRYPATAARPDQAYTTFDAP
jgi:ATP-dependent DNA helicase RecG